jgi:hypothetical protein
MSSTRSTQSSDQRMAQCSAQAMAFTELSGGSRHEEARRRSLRNLATGDALGGLDHSDAREGSSANAVHVHEMVRVQQWNTNRVTHRNGFVLPLPEAKRARTSRPFYGPRSPRGPQSHPRSLDLVDGFFSRIAMSIVRWSTNVNEDGSS